MHKALGFPRTGKKKNSSFSILKTHLWSTHCVLGTEEIATQIKLPNNLEVGPVLIPISEVRKLEFQKSQAKSRPAWCIQDHPLVNDRFGIEMLVNLKVFTTTMSLPAATLAFSCLWSLF
jgi:hypothetical protein